MAGHVRNFYHEVILELVTAARLCSSLRLCGFLQSHYYCHDLRTIADCSGFSISHFVWTAAHLTLGYAYHTIAFFSGVDLVQQTLALLQQFMEELVPQTEKHHFLRTPALCDFLLYVGFMPFSFMDFSFYFINSSGSVFSVNSLLE